MFDSCKPLDKKMQMSERLQNAHQGFPKASFLLCVFDLLNVKASKVTLVLKHYYAGVLGILMSMDWGGE